MAGRSVDNLVAGLISLAVFGLILHFWGNKELAEITHSLHHKFWRTRPIAPEPEGL